MLEFHKDIFAIQWITFAAGMAAIWALYLKPLGKHLRARRDGIAKDLASAEEARAAAEKLKAEFAAEKARLVEENRKLMERTRADAEAFRNELMQKAKLEHESLLRAGRAQLEAERLDAVRKIRNEAAGLVVAATEKLLSKNLNKSTQVSLASKFVKSLKVSRN
jgi:F-type H+-transporting ATPase subunit b